MGDATKSKINQKADGDTRQIKFKFRNQIRALTLFTVFGQIIFDGRRSRFQVMAVVRGSHGAGNQSGSRCISLKMLSTNQIAAFAHLHKQNGAGQALLHN